jgi:excisionase family DNA binding protein
MGGCVIMTQSIQSPYLSVAEAAEYMHISKSYLREIAHSNKIKHYKIGAKRLFRIEDIQAFLDSCSVKPNDPNNFGRKYINSKINKKQINIIKKAVL